MRGGPQPLPTLPDRRPLSSRGTLLVFVVAVLLSGSAGLRLGRFVGTTQKVGIAEDITVDGEPSGVYRLSVGNRGVSELASSAKVRDTSSYVGPLTGDQVASVEAGWDAACSMWTDLGVLGADQGLSCATTSARPVVGHSGMASGPSAGLAHAIVFADWHFDITGDLKVAATGEVRTSTVAHPHTGALTQTVTVHPIGGVVEKTAAAVEAGVDVLVVPADQAAEFFSAVADLGASLDVVAAPTLTSAVHAICGRSRTEVCLERVLTIE